jgi:hypothetical protein
MFTTYSFLVWLYKSHVFSSDTIDLNVQMKTKIIFSQQIGPSSCN